MIRNLFFFLRILSPENVKKRKKENKREKHEHKRLLTTSGAHVAAHLMPGLKPPPPEKKPGRGFCVSNISSHGFQQHAGTASHKRSAIKQTTKVTDTRPQQRR